MRYIAEQSMTREGLAKLIESLVQAHFTACIDTLVRVQWLDCECVCKISRCGIRQRMLQKRTETSSMTLRWGQGDCFIVICVTQK